MKEILVMEESWHEEDNDVPFDATVVFDDGALHIKKMGGEYPIIIIDKMEMFNLVKAIINSGIIETD